MSASAREARDLRDIASALISKRPAPSACAPDPGLEVLPILACGESEEAVLLAVALASFPVPFRTTVASGLPGAGPFRLPAGTPLAKVADGSARLLLLLPPEDGPVLRAAMFAAHRQVLWAAPGALAEARLRGVLSAIGFARADCEVGCLLAPGADVDAVGACLRNWSGAAPGRSAPVLGPWRPGGPLPVDAGEFLLRHEGSPVDATWAWSLLPRL
ncbi:MAG: hypothetical protein KBD01_12295 [Acidobacteria bacterium]|nr:hypothetical protein [Acidobacteriota bacterium]